MKVVLIAAVVAALAVLAAGWKWGGHTVGHAQGQYKIAGWSWGDDSQPEYGTDGWSWGD